MWTRHQTNLSKIERQIERRARRGDWGHQRCVQEIDGLKREIDRAQRGFLP